MHDQAVAIPHYRFTRADLRRMVQTGILDADARVELLDGEVVAMSALGPRHNSVVDRLTEALFAPLAGRAICRVQGSIGLSESSQPHPDLVLLKRRPDFYRDELPAPADILLLIEVAETSPAVDRGRKLQEYARSGIAEYWVVDVVQQVVIVHREPRGAEYGYVRQHDSGPVAPAALADLEIDLADLFA